MISLALSVYAGLLEHYNKKWKIEKIDQKYEKWEKDQQMREEMGFDTENRRAIPKRRIRSNAARKKHSY